MGNGTNELAAQASGTFRHIGLQENSGRHPLSFIDSLITSYGKQLPNFILTEAFLMRWAESPQRERFLTDESARLARKGIFLISIFLGLC
jgi:hypothetical protein